MSESGTIGPDFDQPCEVLEPAILSSPLVVSSPHSGSHYPQSFLAASRLDPLTLRKSEDAYVDELFAGAVAAGAPLLRALFPRAYLDVNREPYELDPRMFDGRIPARSNTRSIRVAGGLGTIARIVSDSREIYKARLPVSEIKRRIEGLYEPYHHRLNGLLDRAWRLYGLVLLLDCHSMPSQQRAVSGQQPSQALRDRAKADVVIGDRYGTSCDPGLVNFLEQRLVDAGLTVQRNKPYAGGFITENYGSPALGVHAIQVELNRALYMNEDTMAKLPEFGALQETLGFVIRDLVAYMESDLNQICAAAE